MGRVHLLAGRCLKVVVIQCAVPDAEMWGELGWVSINLTGRFRRIVFQIHSQGPQILPQNKRLLWILGLAVLHGSLGRVSIQSRHERCTKEAWDAKKEKASLKVLNPEAPRAWLTNGNRG